MRFDPVAAVVQTLYRLYAFPVGSLAALGGHVIFEVAGEGGYEVYSPGAEKTGEMGLSLLVENGQVGSNRHIHPLCEEGFDEPQEMRVELGGPAGEIHECRRDVTDGAEDMTHGG